MGAGSVDSQWLSLAGDLRRHIAVQSLLAEGDESSELVIFASQVERVDAVGGAATLLRAGRHLEEHPSGQVMIVPPTRPSPAEQFLELLSPLPDGVVLTDAGSVPEPRRFALVPATLIPDDASAVAAAGFALEACERARISEVRTNLVGLAVAEIAGNALHHATGTQTPPAVAVTVSGRERVIEIAVVDLGTGISSAIDPAAALGAIPGPANGSGFLADLIRRGNKREIELSIEVMSGTATLRWRWDQHRTENQSFVPGTTVLVRIPA